ncbi:MAG: hypothetical protein RI949_2150, partial [Pseudomonadota bacterium]
MSVKAPTAHSSEGADPSKPTTTPMPSRAQRWSYKIARRSVTSACADKASKAMTREASQPQMSGGKMSARGGTSHKGMLNTKANRATTVHPKDQTKPCHHAEAAPRRTKSG